MEHSFCVSPSFLAQSKKRRWPMDDQIPITWLISLPPPLLSSLIRHEIPPAQTGHRLINVNWECVSPFSRLGLGEQNVGTSCAYCPHSRRAAPHTNISHTFISRGHADGWLRQRHSEGNQPQLFIWMLKRSFITLFPPAAGERVILKYHLYE